MPETSSSSSRDVHFRLESKTKKFVFAGLVALFALAYGALALRQYVAAWYGGKAELASLRMAARLEPDNAEYAYHLGRYYYLIEQDPLAAISAYRTSVQLNPYNASFWLSLAAAYQLSGNSFDQEKALNRAVLAQSRKPQVIWEVANFHLAEGNLDQAFAELRLVLEHDPSFALAAVQRGWRAKPNITSLLRMMPPSADVYLPLLDFLISKNETAASVATWEKMVHLGQPLEKRHVFDYIRYLIEQKHVAQARYAWEQASSLSGLAAYSATKDNLTVNGQFELPVLNAGFDWQYEKQPGVGLSLDPGNAHTGTRALVVEFDGRPVDSAGIWQLIPVQPNTTYFFSAYFRAPQIEAAGGPRFVVQDFYRSTTYFTSDELKNCDWWKQVNGNFVTGPETQLLALRIQRVPAESAIRGQLWIDDVQLTQKQ